MIEQQRRDFRKSSAWKKFKHKMRLRTTLDYITKQHLVRNWNLHHLDLNVDRYDVLDAERFMCLNPKTHELIHNLYKLYRRDRKVIERIKHVLELMYKFTNE